jgi:uncharacterized membrane protein YbhN (UPF0104 family)
MGASLFFLTSRAAALFGAAVWLASLPAVMGFPALVSHLALLARKSRHFTFLQAAVRMPMVPTARFALMAVGAMGTELASFFFLLRAFFPTGFTTAVATYPYIVLAGDLPVSFSGVGVREGAAALLLSPYAVPSEAAVGASLVWFVFAMLLPATLGALWLVVERVKAQMRKADRVAPKAHSIPIPVALPISPPPLHPETVAPRCEAG